MPSYGSAVQPTYITRGLPSTRPLNRPVMDNLLPQPQASKRRYLITGGHGFIGSHIARRMFAAGEVTVRIVDIAPTSALEGPICHEFLKGNLLDMSFCEQALEGVDVVIHLAANMGGMGTIHDDNDFLIYQENHMMTINILQASLDAGVKQLLYASSACVYPQDLQSDQTGDVSLRETAVWTQCAPPSPQGLYGLEKLHSENIMLLEQFATKMDIRIARFHNIFGPGGSWKDGREKAPAAMLRKALALKRVGLSANTTFEVWGDGYQRRSFLYVLDAVDGIMALLQSRHNPGPINIGSDRPVTIQDLANMALECVGLDPKQVSFSYHLDKPVGVMSRNSNNERVKEVLDWEPRITLLEGMQKTCEWMTRQLNQLEAGSGIDEKFLVSKVVHLRPQKITFAILLPITSRGTANATDCLLNLRRFAKSLVNTTWRDTRDTHEGVTFRFAVYLALDADDEFLLPHGRHEGKAQAVLRDEGVFNITSIYCDLPRGHVCALWRKCAKKAWVDGCDYLVLMGDDIILHDEGWMRKAYTEFSDLANELSVPYGFGCVAFTDISFPGMPTFPIVHRTHMDIFGEVVPEIFVNQDGDPFLFQLYRRWNSSRMFTSRISNGVGGESDARYSKAHAQKWKFGPLDQAVSVAHNWLHDQGCAPNRMVTIDVVIPCYRVAISILDRILSLKPTTTACVMFIIIIDDPLSPNISQLQSKYSSRPDVRIRVNRKNLGASASRNRGMEESAADWIHFLDDDVVPRHDLLEQAEKAIRSEPRAIGFVGKSVFPVADTIFAAAVHLAGVTHFWGIAGDSNLADDVPWGVTANLITRRVDDAINFDMKYPKTGGGEDIDFCRLKRRSSLSNKGKGFIAAPDVQVIHPWWNHGTRSYWRFYYWSVGDGGLIQSFPENVYIDYAPNSAEMLLFCVCGCATSSVLLQFNLMFSFCKLFLCVILANTLDDYYRHMWKHPERTASLDISIRRESLLWRLSVIESTFIRMFTEIGRLRGLFLRGEYTLVMKRFDWFAGRLHDAPVMEERMNSVRRAVLSILFFLFLY